MKPPIVSEQPNYFVRIVQDQLRHAVLPVEWPTHSEIQAAVKVIALCNYKGPQPPISMEYGEIINRAFVGEFELDGMSEDHAVQNHVRFQHSINELLAGEIHVVVHQGLALGTLHLVRGLKVLP